MKSCSGWNDGITLEYNTLILEKKGENTASVHLQNFSQSFPLWVLNLYQTTNFRVVQIQAFADDKIIVTQKLKFMLGKGANIV